MVPCRSCCLHSRTWRLFKAMMVHKAYPVYQVSFQDQPCLSPTIVCTSLTCRSNWQPSLTHCCSTTQPQDLSMAFHHLQKMLECLARSVYLCCSDWLHHNLEFALPVHWPSHSLHPIPAHPTSTPHHFAEAATPTLFWPCAEMILESVGKCDVDVRRDLYSGIILTGNT